MRILAYLGLGISVITPTAFGLSFGPAELEKVNWESRQLTPCDVNGNGLKDLAYIDGIERSIDLLVQKKTPTMEPSKAKEEAPPMKLTRFMKERIPTEASPCSFVFGDFSGKGKTELAYTAKKLGIVFMERAANGTWTQTHRLADVEVLPFTHVMWAGKLTHPLLPPSGRENIKEADASLPPLAKIDSTPKSDEPDTLVVLAKGKLLIIKNYQIDASYGMLYESSGFITLNDINGDGRLDITYDYEDPHGFAYRLQDKNGRFDREIMMSYAPETEKNFAYKGNRVFFFGGSTPFVEEREISRTPLKPATEIYSCYPDHAEGVLANIDGEESLVVSDAKGSELIMYRKSPAGWTNPERFPSLKNVTSLVKLMGESPDALAIFSPEEHAVGISTWDAKNKRLAFPKLVELADEPVGLFGSDGRAWVLTKNDKEFFLQRIADDGTAFTASTPIKLEGLKRAPESVVCLRQKDAATLIVMTSSRDNANFYLTGTDGKLSVVKPSVALMRANFSNLDGSRMGRGDLGGNGGDQLIVTQHSTLRLFKFSKGTIELADQVLPFNDDANLKFPFVQNGVLSAYDAKSNNFLKFERGADHLWHNTGQLESPSIAPESILISGENPWIVFGRRAFYTLNPVEQGVTLATTKRYESNLKLDGYNWGSLENLEGADKAPDAILFSQAKKILEVVSWGETPKSLVNFELYKQDMHYSGRTGEEIEPREIIAADVTGNGKESLIMLIHNKILVYPQK